MNPTDAEKLDGMEAGGIGIVVSKGLKDPWLVVDKQAVVGLEKTYSVKTTDLLTLCRAVVGKVDGPAKPTDIERIIYALELWMKRIEQGIPLQQNMQIGGWETRWNRMKKVITDWKAKGEMPK